MKVQITEILGQILAKMGVEDVIPQVDFPADLNHGDFTTNVAMVLAKRLKRNPLDIANEIKDSVQRLASSVKNNGRDQSTYQSDQKGSGIAEQKSVLQDIEKIEVVPPGFINVHLAVSALSTSANSVQALQFYSGQAI